MRQNGLSGIDHSVFWGISYNEVWYPGGGFALIAAIADRLHLFC